MAPQARKSLVKEVSERGTLFSPLMFVLVANGLHHMIAKCWDLGLIHGLGCRDDTNVVVNLHYTDDTLEFRKESVAQAMILKWVLLCYECWYFGCLTFIGEERQDGGDSNRFEAKTCKEMRRLSKA